MTMDSKTNAVKYTLTLLDFIVTISDIFKVIMSILKNGVCHFYGGLYKPVGCNKTSS